MSMEPSRPNSLIHALAANKPRGEHPDADLLTAFAEGSLLAREREDVMAHVAHCAECREVLSLAGVADLVPAHEFGLVAAAAPAMAAPVVAPRSQDRQKRPTRSKSRVWLPWAAAACLAGISVAVIRYEHQTTKPTAVPESSSAVAVNAPPPAPLPATQGKPAVSAPLRAEPAKKKANAQGVRPHENARLQEAVPAFATTRNGDVARQSATESVSVASGQSVETTRQQDVPQNLIQDSVSQQQQSARAVAEPRTASPPSISASAPSFVGAFAKSAMKADASAHWRIDVAGHLESSYGQGPWEPVAVASLTKVNVVAVIGGAVWVGGENDALYLSHDRGLTWQGVPLPEKDGRGHTLAHIRFENALSGTVEAADGTKWATADGGTSWR
jgi:hypothetical protein